MKKLFLIAVLLGSAVCAQAAPKAKEVSYAPKAGSFSTEIQFNPFSGKDVFSNGGVFSGTYFVSNKSALSFEIGLSGSNSKDQYFDSDDKADYYTSKYNGKFTIGIGYKNYFHNYKRINLYAGAKANFVHEFAGNKKVLSNGRYDWNNEGTGNGFSVYALTGIDFSIYAGLYVGAELNVGFEDVLKSGSTYKNTILTGQLEETKNKAGGHSLEGGFGVNPMFRLGWKF